MPYITKEEREQYEVTLDDLCFALEEEGYQEGHVTYVLYMIVARWFRHIPKYKSICRIRGVLTGTKAEFDRQIAEPYERQKIQKNGDVDLTYHTLNPCVEIDVTEEDTVQKGKLPYHVCPCCAHEHEVKG